MFKNINVRYVDHMGGDLRVVNAARVSFKKESSEFVDKDAKLINYLAKHKHWTPFSHPMITLVEEVPIYVARQRFKHMVGFTYNEVSRRYVDDSPEFHNLFGQWRERPDGSIKQGSGSLIEDQNRMDEIYTEVCDLAFNKYHEASKLVAPEQARSILPQGMMTEYYVTGSLYAFANAYRQRIDGHAQKEIQDLAKKWDEIIRPLFPVSWEALVGGER